MTRTLVLLALGVSLTIPTPVVLRPAGLPAPTLDRHVVPVIAAPHQARQPARASRSAQRSDAALWDALATCESRGRWHLNVGTYDGGLQFHPATWASVVRRHRLPVPAFAWRASRSQQVTVARIVLREQGFAAWPGCARKLGLLTRGG